jgi:multidrug resistance efflux pump
MRATVATLVLGLCCLIGASASQAAGTSLLTGKITKVDTSAKTVVVKEQFKPQKEMTFSLASNAKILAGSKEKSLADLKVGERVKVSYTTEGMQHRAEKIEMLGMKTASAKPPKPTSNRY